VVRVSRTPEQLSTSTLFFLFARDWLPHDPVAPTVPVPGGRVTASTAYANLVGAALWSLVRHDMVRLVPLRALDRERLTFLGGKSYVRVEPTGRALGAVAGLEELLLRHVQQAESVDDNDLRRLLARVTAGASRVWPVITSPGYTELVDAGIVRQRGWVVRRLEVVDPAGVERARPSFDERRRLRAADIEQDPATYQAVTADGLESYQWLTLRPELGSALGARLRQRQHPVGDLGGERDHGRGPDDVRVGQHPVDHPLQVGVGPRDHPRPHVAGAGDGVRLEHLRDGGQGAGDGVVAGTLPDLQGEERGHRVAERRGVQHRSPAGDHAALLELVEPGLDGAAGDPEPPGGLEDADPGLGGEQLDQVAVDLVH
jgi:hypothetical protein